MLIDSINTYLSMRRGLGFKLNTVEYYLRSYAKIARGRGENHVVSRTAIEWAAESRSANSRARRLQILVRFSKFARIEDNQHEIPSNVYCSKWQRRTPYLFTDQEVVQLILSAQRLGPPGSLRSLTYSTLLGLMASTGLRISEALSLQVDDITNDGIVVRETKFKKSRLVPLHPTVVAALERYLQYRHRVACGDHHVFVSPRSKRKLCYGVVATTFQKILKAAGIQGHPNHPRPHLHGLRHRFAIKALESCPESRDWVARHILALSTYMGHAHVGCTYWYLESTPQLMTDIVSMCESFMNGGES